MAYDLLTRRERRICELYYIEDLSVAEVVAALEEEGIALKCEALRRERATVERDLRRIRGYIGIGTNDC